MKYLIKTRKAMLRDPSDGFGTLEGQAELTLRIAGPMDRDPTGGEGKFIVASLPTLNGVRRCELMVPGLRSISVDAWLPEGGVPTMRGYLQLMLPPGSGVDDRWIYDFIETG